MYPLMVNLQGDQCCTSSSDHNFSVGAGVASFLIHAGGLQTIPAADDRLHFRGL